MIFTMTGLLLVYSQFAFVVRYLKKIHFTLVHL
jgi:hypothetical protein